MKFLLKCGINGILVIPLLMWFTEATFLEALLTAVALCAVAYVIGDQLILRGTNNTVATVADAALTYVFLWLAAVLMDWDLSFTELTIIVVAVAIAEIVFHRILAADRGRGRA